MNQEYKCPNCGAAVNFDIESQQVVCPYCDTEFDVKAFAEYDNTLNANQEDNMNWESRAGKDWEAGETDGMVEYVCKSCGGTIVCDINTTATSCPYCDNPVVMMSNLSGMLKPDIIIPFKITKEAAKKAYIKHLRGKPLLPDKFKDENHIDEIKGLYVPFWLFDADVDASMQFRGTKIRHWSDMSYHYTEYSYYSVFRAAKMGFMNVPVDGSTKMPDDLMESVEPFLLAEADEFRTAYLAGYYADKYDVDADDSMSRANDRIKASATAMIRGTVIGYSKLSVDSSSVNLHDSSSKYAMYPIWILATTWNDKKYLFAMNGQTGKFVGDLPVDKKKFWGFFTLFAIVFSALVFIAAYLILA